MREGGGREGEKSKMCDPAACLPLVFVWSLDEVEHEVQEMVTSLRVRMTSHHTQQHWNQLLTQRERDDRLRGMDGWVDG